MRKRDLVLDKYGISGKRYKELCGFCEQYPEWKAFLREETNTVKARTITDMPVAHNNGDATGDLAVKRVEIARKCEIIEETAKEASEDLASFLIKSVCYEVPYTYLQTVEEMPCSRSCFYDTRRYFFFLLDRNKEK